MAISSTMMLNSLALAVRLSRTCRSMLVSIGVIQHARVSLRSWLSITPYIAQEQLLSMGRAVTIE